MTPDQITAAVAFIVFIGMLAGFTFGGSTVPDEDRGLPFYRQRIEIGWYRRSHASRWKIWAVWLAFPLVLLGFMVLGS
jgi:hypothetical protein